MKSISGILIVVVYIIFSRVLSITVRRIGERKQIRTYRIKYIKKTINLCLTLVFLMIFMLSLGIEYAQVSLFLSSAFAVLGVALFAQWSILSNITASLIIFFAFPYRVGDKIRIIDEKVDLSGEIEEISLFHVIIRTNNDLITYPNNLILQKAVVKLDCVSK